MQLEQLNIMLPGGVPADVHCAGDGAPLVYLHGRLGRHWGSWLDGLAEQHRVYAPLHPGVANEEDLAAFGSVHDLALYYDDLFNNLKLERPILVGHGFGGMAAAEYAAHFPDKVSRLILIGSLGLWDDTLPVGDIDATPAPQVPQLLFRNPAQPDVAAAMALPEEPQAQAAAMLERMAVVAATNHFIWPIPDRNLKQRLHRITCPTLLLWGQDDAYVPARYAQYFARSISGSEVALIDEAGHHPHVEQSSATEARIRAFVA